MALTTSPDDAARPQSAESGPGGFERAISEQIWKHLGSLLAAVYAQDQTGLSATDRIADLLGRLDAALGDARDRNDTAFQGLLLPALRRFALSLARDASAADDLVQETLLRAWRNRARFKPGTKFEAWTFTILRNHFNTVWRKRCDVQDDDGADAARLIAPPDQMGRLDLQDLQAALDRLPATMRAALMLVTFSDLSYEEAAAVMGCRVGTVKSQVSRAREQLARALGYTGAEVGTDTVMLSALGQSGEARR
ncbi:sigma-70 family RNA polymerase sigma factor [Methylobacterium sp. J-030]|uniref:sigma-70 family RNA polymerase sigma factor n=1 Tax=Methylobacterium sp. J-030 TaxID=2836627 RepID=UPI001FB969C7|nr:sigma-70 family RNA polymerase sigma factor [Methylobacterium sp. J-030]MCJ2069696.1 sigma-70 family RNA polymerase sigma factor [Methylobacterium sp. J-030]